MRARERLLELANPRNAALLLRIISVDLFIAVMLKFAQPRKIIPYLAFRTRTSDAKIVNMKTVNQDRVRTIVRYTDFLIWRNIPALRGACLKRSLILYHFLRKEGLPVVINIGVAKEDGSLIGHSWLTLNNVPYYETREHAERFNVVLSYPST